MKKALIGFVCVLLPLLVMGDTFNRFTPATGILVGTSTSPTTTAASSSDVISLWTGTCSATSFLRGDGSCQTPPGTGTVTSVALSVPTGLSVTGSPITIAGTLGITTSLDGPLLGTGSGFAIAESSDIISLWSGTCNSSTFMKGDGSCGAALSGTVAVANGGTGATTLSGVLKGNNTSAITSATSSDVISLWSGTCNSTNFLRGDGSCTAPIGTVSSVGLSVPTGLSVTGSPVTSSGTLGITTTLSGVLRGTGSGFGIATSPDIRALWSGTCNSTTFLRGDGSCETVAATGGGTVTSVGLTMPAGLSVSGSPITSSGTLAVTGTLAVAAGGTGTTTSTGSGSVVLSASPTLTGTTTVGTVSGAAPVGTNLVVNRTTAGSGVFVSNTSAGSGTNLVLNVTNVTDADFGVTLSQVGAASKIATVGPSVAIPMNLLGTPVQANGSQVCTANGTGCPQRFAYARITANSGGCSVNTGVANANIASCTRTGLGSYTVTFSVGAFTSNSPFCTAHHESQAFQPSVAAGPPGTAAFVSTYDSVGAAADTGFKLMCIG